MTPGKSSGTCLVPTPLDAEDGGMPNADIPALLGNADESVAGSAAPNSPRAAAVTGVALACGAFATYAISLSIEKAPWPWWMQIPIQSAGMFALAAGIIVLVRRPRLGGIGTLLVAYGLTWYIGDLQFSEHQVLYAVGFCLFFFNAAVMAQIVLSFPSGRLRDPIATLVVTSLYGAILITQTVRYFVEESPPPQVWGDPNAGTYSPWATAGTVAGMVLCATVFVLLVRRWRSASPPMRRNAAPVWFSATLATVIVGGFLIVALTHAPAPMNHILLFGYASSVLLVPVASQVGALRGWIGRVNAFERLADFEQAESAGYRELLAKWLGDPSIEIHPWLPSEERYANSLGETIILPADPSRVTFLEWDGRPLGALIHDSFLAGAPQLRSVATVTRIVLERAALQAELRRNLDQLQEASQMLIDQEIERRKDLQIELHDGGQDEVIGLLVILADLRRRLGTHVNPGVTELLEEGVARSKQLQRQIKDVAFKLSPPALEEFGLRAGVMSLRDRLRLPVDVDIPETRWPKRVEYAAYGVVSEALRNAMTHAQARTIRVIATHQHDRLIVEIVDDGLGGVNSSKSSGVGIQRVEKLVTVLGGKLSIDSPLGVGTHVKAELPCTS